MDAAAAQDGATGTADGLLAALPGLAVVVGPDGRILAANRNWFQAAQANGLDASRATAFNYLGVCMAAHGADAAPAKAAAAGIAAVLSRSRGEYSLQYPAHAARRRQWFRMSATPLEWAGERAALVLHLEVTADGREPHADNPQLLQRDEVLRLNRRLERRVARRTRQLELANRELEAFSYSVSHDLKAPLAAIDGFTQVLVERLEGQVEERDFAYLQRVRAGVASMFGLIDALLALARLSSDIRLDRQEVDLSALALRIIDEFKEQEPARPCVIRIEPAIRAECDPRLVDVVLRNLLGNAWKFSARKQVTHISVDVDADAPEGLLCVRVRDHGAGFDPQYARRLFTPFQRLHHSSDFPGTGIGLATVQRIVHRHGGTVRATGTPGEGATVWFTLPVAGWASSESLHD